MDDFDMQKKEVHTDENGLMNDAEELREMVHSMTATVHQVINVPHIRAAMGEELYEGLETMMASAHALVCPKAAGMRGLLGIIEALFGTEDDEESTTEELPTLSLTEEDKEWLSKLSKDL